MNIDSSLTSEEIEVQEIKKDKENIVSNEVFRQMLKFQGSGKSRRIVMVTEGAEDVVECKNTEKNKSNKVERRAAKTSDSRFEMKITGCVDSRGVSHDGSFFFDKWSTAYKKAVSVLDEFRGAKGTTKWTGNGNTRNWNGIDGDKIRSIVIDEVKKED